MLSPFYELHDTFRTFDLLTREMNRYFEAPRASNASKDLPTFDLYEKDDAWIFVAELPGVTKDDLSLTVEGNLVEIAAKRDVAVPEGFEARVRERRGFSFERKFKVAGRLDAAKAEARLENGILTLTLPKAPEPKAQKIAIKEVSS